MANRMPGLTIQGDAEFLALLESLPERTLAAGAKALRKAAAPVVRAAKGNLKRGHGVATGQLKKSLGIRKVKTYKREGRVVLYIGPRRGYAVGRVMFKGNKVIKTGKAKHDPFYIAHLVEYGHRIAGRGGAVRGYPFLRPAMDGNRNNTLAILKAELKAEIERRATKAMRNQAKGV